jgi:hypothetical protein
MRVYRSAMDRTSLFIDLYAGRERLRAALASLPEPALLDRVDDEWTRKDVIAHIGAWERRLVDLLERLRRGEWPEEEVETDELNARMYANDVDRSVAEILRLETADWDRFVAAIEGMTDEELFDPHKFGWTQGDPFVEWVTANANEHIDEHLEQLTRPARASSIA